MILKEVFLLCMKSSYPLRNMMMTGLFPRFFPLWICILRAAVLTLQGGNFKYKGNLLDIIYSHEGKFIDKILVNGQSVCSRIVYIPEGSLQYKIEIQLSSWPGNPILNSIKTNSWYRVLRCSYDDKTGIFNIEMESPLLEDFKAIINITKNSKWIKRVTINWKDISRYENIQVEYKDKGF